MAVGRFIDRNDNKMDNIAIPIVSFVTNWSEKINIVISLFVWKKECAYWFPQLYDKTNPIASRIQKYVFNINISFDYERHLTVNLILTVHFQSET